MLPRHLAALGLSLLAYVGVATVWSGCAAGSDAEPATTTSTGSAGSSSTTTSNGGAGGTGTPTGSGGGGALGGGGTGATGGTGGSGGSWPNCDSNPGGQLRTIPEIWQDDPATETAVWVPGVIVTAVSYGACSASYPCQLFVQQDATYADWNAGAQHAIKFFASPATAHHFTGIAHGDVVDIYAHAVRYTQDGRNELLLLVNDLYPGCAKDVGDASPVPIANVTLDLLTVNSYEYTHGPLFIRIDDVTGNPAQSDEIFALWETGNCCGGTIEEVTNLSPYSLPGGQFQGLTQGVQTDFDYVEGVFGQFVPSPPPDPPPKYELIYPRTHTEYPTL